MMMANAFLDIPAIRRIDKVGNVHSRRHSTGKVIVPSGGLTVLSRYLRSSQGSCHDNCKHDTNTNTGTYPKIPRRPMRKTVVPKRGAERNSERVSESNLVDRRKKTGISVKVSPNFKIQEPGDHAVTKIAETQGHHVENVEQDSTVSVMTSNDAEPQKPEYPAIGLEPSREEPVDIETKAVGGEAKDEENVETKSQEGTSVKPSPDSESQKPVNPDCIEDGVSSWTDKESVLPEQVETDYVVAHAKDSKMNPRSKPSSLVRQTCPNGKQNSKVPKRKEANIMSKNKGAMIISKGTRTSVNADKKSAVLPSVSSSHKESGTSVSSTNARTKKLRPVYHLKKQENEKQIKVENVKKFNSEQAKSANVPKTTSYPIETNPENKPAESNQNKVVPMRPSSSSKDKSMKHNQNRIPISRSPRAYEKTKMIYRPKGIQTSGSPRSSSSFPRRKSSRFTPNGLKTTQPSSTSLPSSASLESFHNDTLTENVKALAEKKKGSPKMMYKAKSKRALMITSNNKHLPGKKLNFKRAKAIEAPVEDFTPRRLTFKKRDPIDNRKGKVEDCTPRRLKFRQRVNGDNKNSRVEEFAPKRLKFRQRVNGDNQNGKVEELTPRRLKFKRRVNVDNSQNCRVGANADDQNVRGENSTPRKLIFRPKVVGEKKTGYVRSPKADVSCDNDREIQSEKVSLRHRGVNEKKGSGILCNNIIEQTANRLAETKASKVKALVSAFETVINRLDTGIPETNDASN
ncbi:hypothetical protein HRI_005043500 [Hibiscus trionum]|uniref:Calmodulin-binding domain-containing protein n=1 Tax=Hibiscus trionum TaxID=183268 RepID=A0A9W7JFM5_HIBTR|nr:hypothetical protein HRI_005043500 [Hibiscus trionum]